MQTDIVIPEGLNLVVRSDFITGTTRVVKLEFLEEKETPVNITIMNRHIEILNHDSGMIILPYEELKFLTELAATI